MSRRRGGAINAFIRDAPRRWANLSVLDFSPAIAEDRSILQGDGLHFSREAGTPARRIAAATQRRLRLSGLG